MVGLWVIAGVLRLVSFDGYGVCGWFILVGCVECGCRFSCCGVCC